MGKDESTATSGKMKLTGVLQNVLMHVFADSGESREVEKEEEEVRNVVQGSGKWQKYCKIN